MKFTSVIVVIIVIFLVLYMVFGCRTRCGSNVSNFNFGPRWPKAPKIPRSGVPVNMVEVMV